MARRYRRETQARRQNRESGQWKVFGDRLEELDGNYEKTKWMFWCCTVASQVPGASARVSSVAVWAGHSGAGDARPGVGMRDWPTSLVHCNLITTSFLCSCLCPAAWLARYLCNVHERPKTLIFGHLQPRRTLMGFRDVPSAASPNKDRSTNSNTQATSCSTGAWLTKRQRHKAPIRTSNTYHCPHKLGPPGSAPLHLLLHLCLRLLAVDLPLIGDDHGIRGFSQGPPKSRHRRRFRCPRFGIR